MTNRRMQDSDFVFGTEDDPIGLTSAFPATKGPQSVEYDKGDEAIGLTGAFAPIVLEDDERSWDENSKWKNYDWSSYQSEEDEQAEPAAEAAEPAEAAEVAEDAEADKTPEGDTSESAAPQADAPKAGGAHASGTSSSSSKSSGRGRHAAPDIEMSPRMQKARKTRRTLVLLVILVILIIIAVAVYSVRLFNSSQEEAAHQAQEQIDAPKEDIGDELSDDAGNPQAKLTEVPNLTSLFGMTTDEAVKAIGHGAMALPAREVKEEGNPITSTVNVPLNDEPVDSKTGVPTVYLGLDKDGKVIQAGYSASASALGFGSLSFTDAVNGDHVIEKTLSKIGVDVPEGSAVLPADKKEYSTFGSDGTTVTRERCSFEGDADVDGKPCTWSSVLSYDYTTQIVTGDLADTVRIIYVYITQK